MPVALALFLGGCAALGTRTEGTSGPVAWRVVDLAVVTKDVQGQPVDSSTVTLQIRNVSDRTVTFMKMDRAVYRPGTNSGSTSHTGRWELRPVHVRIDVVLPSQAVGPTPIVR